METRQLTSEKITATVVAAELTGLNQLSEKTEVDVITGIINQCHQTIASVVNLFGGTVNKIMGDSAIASFGISGAFDTAPGKAIGACFEIKSRINEYADENVLFGKLGIKFGIKTGQVISGEIASEDTVQHTVMGETVNLAARICDIAENGQLLTGKNTFDRSKDSFSFRILEPIPLKGLSRPLPVFEVIEKVQTLTHEVFRKKREIQSVMIGRRKEFRKIEKQFMQLLNGRGSVVTVAGRAGIGKSRLMAELKNSELIKKVALLEGKALSNGSNLSFHPIIQIIKSWAGIQEGESSEDSKKKLQTNIRRIYPEGFDEAFPFIATMMAYRLEGKAKERVDGIEGEALEKLILKNMRDLLSKAAAIRPVVIVIEDAHWCDITSVIFMESLFKLAQKQRLMFVSLFRPGYKETGERLSKFLKETLNNHHIEITVEPLTNDESKELICNLLQKTNLPPEINDLIIERSSGNPFFIEEVIRSFIDEGLIEIKDDRFILSENIKFANIPETIDRVILNRIDRLDDKTKNLLRTASVIGRNFYYKVLEEAAQTIEEVDYKLEYLKDVQLINKRKQKDEVEFLFKHALAQQATYESILEERRRDLHLKIAKSIEKVFHGRINEFYGTLAHHYSKAGQADKTEEYLIKAGEESIKSGASSEAVNFLKEALLLIDQKNKQNQQKIIDLEEKLALGLAITGQYIESIEYCDRIIAYYYKPFPKSDFRRLINLTVSVLLLYRIIYFFKRGPDSGSKGMNHKLIKVFITQSHSFSCIDPKRLFFDTPTATRFVKRKQFGNYEAVAMMLLGSVFFHTGILFSLGMKLVSWGERMIDESYVPGWIRMKFSVAMRDYEAGKKAEVLDEKKVLEAGIQSGEFFYTTNYYYYHCFSLVESGNVKLVQHFMNRVNQITEAFDCAYSQSLYHRMNMTYHLKFRKLDEVIKIADESVGFLLKNDVANILLPLYAFRSMACTFKKDFTEATKYLSKAESIAKSLKILTLINLYLIAKCQLEVARFQHGEGKKMTVGIILKTTKRLIKLAQKVRKNLPEAYRLRAIMFRLINKQGKAFRNFEKSIIAGSDYDCKLELSRTYFEAGKFLSDPKTKYERINGMNTTECLLKAKSMFEEMNLEWDLQEYDEFMASGMK